MRIKNPWRFCTWFFEALWFLLRGSGDRYIEVRAGCESDEEVESNQCTVISVRPDAIPFPTKKKATLFLVRRCPTDPDSAA